MCECRGPTLIKGKGTLITYFVHTPYDAHSSFSAYAPRPDEGALLREPFPAAIIQTDPQTLQKPVAPSVNPTVVSTPLPTPQPPSASPAGTGDMLGLPREVVIPKKVVVSAKDSAIVSRVVLEGEVTSNLVTHTVSSSSSSSSFFPRSHNRGSGRDNEWRERKGGGEVVVIVEGVKDGERKSKSGSLPLLPLDSHPPSYPSLLPSPPSLPLSSSSPHVSLFSNSSPPPPPPGWREEEAEKREKEKESERRKNTPSESEKQKTQMEKVEGKQTIKEEISIQLETKDSSMCTIPVQPPGVCINNYKRTYSELESHPGKKENGLTSNFQGKLNTNSHQEAGEVVIEEERAILRLSNSSTPQTDSDAKETVVKYVKDSETNTRTVSKPHHPNSEGVRVEKGCEGVRGGVKTSPSIRKEYKAVNFTSSGLLRKKNQVFV